MDISENNQEKELRELFREIRLDSPSPGFTGKVMDLLEAETSGVVVSGREPLLGKRFWMLVLLFLIPLALLPAFGNTKESFLMMLADRYLSGWSLSLLPDWHAPLSTLVVPFCALAHHLSPTATFSTSFTTM